MWNSYTFVLFPLSNFDQLKGFIWFHTLRWTFTQRHLKGFDTKYIDHPLNWFSTQGCVLMCFYWSKVFSLSFVSSCEWEKWYCFHRCNYVDFYYVSNTLYPLSTFKSLFLNFPGILASKFYFKIHHNFTGEAFQVIAILT